MEVDLAVAVIGAVAVLVAALIAAIVAFERMRRENAGSHGEAIEMMRDTRADVRELRVDVRALKSQHAYDVGEAVKGLDATGKRLAAIEVKLGDIDSKESVIEDKLDDIAEE